MSESLISVRRAPSVTRPKNHSRSHDYYTFGGSISGASVPEETTRLSDPLWTAGFLLSTEEDNGMCLPSPRMDSVGEKYSSTMFVCIEVRWWFLLAEGCLTSTYALKVASFARCEITQEYCKQPHGAGP